MELYRTYGAIECSGIIDNRVAPYPKLYHPFRVFVELTLINVLIIRKAHQAKASHVLINVSKLAQALLVFVELTLTYNC